MFLETIRTPGLAHLSYVIGDAGRAAVIDPRLDFEVYLDRARAHDARIELVFETHRNEDLVSGARALADATGARVLHGTALDFGYGEGAEHGHEERLGNLRLEVLHTPGHTDESLSVAYWDMDYADGAVGVFTGDALFVGDVGRTDFHPDRREEDAGRLFDSIHDELLPLGDQAAIHPAHGAGSVCGDGMASRDASTLGHERRNNPRLRLSRARFVAAKVAEWHVHPPYFERMEMQNRAGREALERLPTPRALAPDELRERLAAELMLVDVRSPEAFAGMAIPGSLALPISLLSGYAGWFLRYDRPLGIVAESAAQEREAVEQLARMDFTRIEASPRHGVTPWQTQGFEIQSIATISADQLWRRLDNGVLTVLDVRKRSEFEAGHVPGAEHAFLGELDSHLDRLRGAASPIVTFCGSGKRAIVAASLLARAGCRDVTCCFGSMKAWRAIGAPVAEGAADRASQPTG